MAQIQGKQIANNAVTAAQIANGTITSAKVDASVTVASGANPFTGDQSMGGHKLTNLAAPTNPSDACTYAVAQALAQGLVVKGSVAALATTNIALTGLQTIDGITLTAGQRVGVIGETSGVQNGIWLAAAGAWTRSADMAAGSSAGGTFFFVESGGTDFGATGWFCTDVPPNDVVGTNALTFTQFSGAGSYTAGDGLDLVGNQFNVNPGTGLKITGGPGSGGTLVPDFGVAGQIQPVAPTNAAAAGATGKPADAGHVHTLPTAASTTPIQSDASGTTTGTANTVLRSDALLVAATAAPVGLANANTQGTSTSLARADHAHQRDVQRQEVIAAQNITGTDTTLVANLSATPIANANVELTQNGLLQTQGAGADYTVSGTAITWLAGSGTATALATTDVLVARYASAT